MKTIVIDVLTAELQQKLYEKLHESYNNNNVKGQLLSIPVSFIDVTLETFKSPLKVIESVVTAILNLLGSIFKDTDCNLKDFIFHSEIAVRESAGTIISFTLFIPKLIYQITASFSSPSSIESINYYPQLGQGNKADLNRFYLKTA